MIIIVTIITGVIFYVLEQNNSRDTIQSNARNEACAYCHYYLSHTAFSTGALCIRENLYSNAFRYYEILVALCMPDYSERINSRTRIRQNLRFSLFRVPYSESAANRMISISSLGVFTNDPCLTMSSINGHGQRSGIPLYTVHT